MRKIKLSAITIEDINHLEICPVRVEDYVEATLDDCYPEVELLRSSKRKQGKLIRELDETMFRLCCRDTEEHNVRDKAWIEVEGEFFDVSEIIETAEEFDDVEIENDL